MPPNTYNGIMTLIRYSHHSVQRTGSIKRPVLEFFKKSVKTTAGSQNDMQETAVSFKRPDLILFFEKYIFNL